MLMDRFKPVTRTFEREGFTSALLAEGRSNKEFYSKIGMRVQNCDF